MGVRSLPDLRFKTPLISSPLDSLIQLIQVDILNHNVNADT